MTNQQEDLRNEVSGVVNKCGLILFADQFRVVEYVGRLQRMESN